MVGVGFSVFFMLHAHLTLERASKRKKKTNFTVGDWRAIGKTRKSLSFGDVRGLAMVGRQEGISRQDITVEELLFGSSRYKKIEHNTRKIKNCNLQLSGVQTPLCSIRHVQGSSSQFISSLPISRFPAQLPGESRDDHPRNKSLRKEIPSEAHTEQGLNPSQPQLRVCTLTPLPPLRLQAVPSVGQINNHPSCQCHTEAV